MNNLYNIVDWAKITASLTNGVDITTDPEYWDFDTPGYSEIYKMWNDANFNKNAIKWTNFYPSTHYPQEVVDDVAKHLGLIGVHRSWISRVDPGNFAPWHWDVDDNEQEYLKKGTIKRYSIMLSGPTFGHIFILGDDYYYNTPAGTILEWNNYKEWHSGINAGMKPKYMFHIIGY
jgi:hypothetical protein